MSSFNSKKLLPYLWIVIGFAIIAFIYCYPQLSGKKLSAGDSISWEASVHEAKTVYEATGKPPLWTNSMFGGMPLFAMYLPGVNNYINPIPEIVQKVIPDPAFMFFLAMLGFFILSCTLKFNKWAGAIGAVAYAFATYNATIIAAGHPTKMYAIGCLPGVIAGFLMIYNGRRLYGAALMGIFLPLMISWHPQIVYYTAITLAVVGVVIAIEQIRQKRVKDFLISTAVIIGVSILCLGPSLSSTLTLMEYTKYTMRGGNSELKQENGAPEKKSGGLDKDYAFNWSSGVGETFCILIPNLYGGGSAHNVGTDSKFYSALTSIGFPEQYAEQYAAQAPLYWGPQPMLVGPSYLGAVICFLFVLGMLIVRSPHKWWIIATAALGLLMAMGNHFPAFNYFLFDHLPMYNKFRTPTMMIVIPQLMFPLLGVWALNDIFTEKIGGEALWKKIKTATLITAGICVAFMVGSQMFLDFKSPKDEMTAARFAQSANNDASVGQRVMKAIQEDRASTALKSSMSSALFVIAAAALLWAFSKKKLNRNMTLAGLAILVAIDLFPIAQEYLNKDSFQEEGDYEARFSPRPVDLEIMKDKDPYYRVFDLSVDTYNDAVQAYFHKCVGGYSPAKMEEYQDLIDVHLSRGFNTEVLNMLNTRYIIFNGGPNNQPAFQQNPGACGNAWFVDEVKYAANATEEMSAMNAQKIGDTTIMPNAWKAAHTAVIRKDFAATIGNTSSWTKDSTAAIKLDKYGLDDISFVSANAHDGLAVFSDIYYDKGWKAYIDGKETPIVKADYVLRAIKVPAGTHKINFSFRPETYYKSNTLAMISSILLYLLFGAALFLAFRKGQISGTATNTKN